MYCSHIGEGNGNPLHCSCLENPRDGGAWWADVYGITQSWTRLKRLSSSSSSRTRYSSWTLAVNETCLSSWSLQSHEFEKTENKQGKLIFIGRYMTISIFSSVQLLSHVRLCDPMNCSTPGLPVHHQLPEFTQTHAHWVGDAIQPSHPLSSPSPPAPNPSQHQGLFQWVNSLHQVAKVLEFQLQHWSFQWTPRTNLL